MPAERLRGMVDALMDTSWPWQLEQAIGDAVEEMRELLVLRPDGCEAGHVAHRRAIVMRLALEVQLERWGLGSS